MKIRPLLTAIVAAAAIGSAFASEHYVPVTDVSQLREGNKYIIEVCHHAWTISSRRLTLNSSKQAVWTAPTDTAYTSDAARWSVEKSGYKGSDSSSNAAAGDDLVYLKNGDNYLALASRQSGTTISTTTTPEAANALQFYTWNTSVVNSSMSQPTVYFGITYYPKSPTTADGITKYSMTYTLVVNVNGANAYCTNQTNGIYNYNYAKSDGTYSQYYKIYMVVEDLDSDLETSVKYHSHLVTSQDDLKTGDQCFMVLNREKANASYHPVTIFNEQRMFNVTGDNTCAVTKMNEVTEPINTIWTITKSGTGTSATFKFSNNDQYIVYTQGTTSCTTNATGTAFTMVSYPDGGNEIFFLKYGSIAWSMNSDGTFGQLTGNTTSKHEDYYGWMRFYKYDPSAYFGDFYRPELEKLVTDAKTAIGTSANSDLEEYPLIAEWTAKINTFCATAYAGTTEVDAAYQALYDEITSVTSSESFVNDALNTVWAPYDGKTVLIKNKRSSWYMAANSDTNKLMIYATPTESSLWTLKKVENGGNKFKLYNQASGTYAKYASGTSAQSSPDLATTADDATEFAFVSYDSSSSYAGYIYILTSGMENTASSCLHESQASSGNPYSNIMYHHYDDAGTPFSLEFIDTELITPLCTDISTVGDIGVETVDENALSQYSSGAMDNVTANSSDAQGTDVDAVYTLLGYYQTLLNSRQCNYPVFRVVNDDDIYSLTTGTSFTFDLSDPLNKNMYWRIAATSNTPESGTYRIANYSTGVNLFGSTDISVTDNLGVASASVGNREGWSLVYVGTTNELNALASSLSGYSAGSLPKARFIARHHGTGLGEYTEAEGTENIKQTIEDFLSHTADIATYTANSDAVATESTDILNCTLNMPQTGRYLRMKAAKKYAISSLSGKQTYYSSNLSGSIAACVADKTSGTNASTTVFYYAPNPITYTITEATETTEAVTAPGVGHLISYATGGYSSATADKKGQLTFCTNAADNTTALATPKRVNVGFEPSESECGTYIFRFNFAADSLSSGRTPSPAAAGSATGAGEGTTSVLANHLWSNTEVELVETLPVTMPDDEITTLQLPVGVRIPSAEGFTFYVGNLNDNKFSLHMVSAGEKFAANTPLIITGSGTVDLPLIYDEDADLSSRYSGTTTNVVNTTFAAPADQSVVFAKIATATNSGSNNAPQMRRAASDNSAASITLTKLTDDNEIAANTMLVTFDKDTKVAQDEMASISVELPTDTDEILYDITYDANTTQTLTSISEVNADSDSNAALYDLQGRRINGNPAHGIYIRGNRKVRL